MISYDDLLDVFWQLHDPTSMDDQGPYEQAVNIVGSSFPTMPTKKPRHVRQRRRWNAEGSITSRSSPRWPATKFWPAEDHQRYIQTGGTHHCNVFNRAVTFPCRGQS